MIRIITHRGLDPDRKFYFPESSLEAFQDHVSRGFDLEFDLQMTPDGTMVVSHHQATGPSLDQLFSLQVGNSACYAIHVKHFMQVPEILDRIVEAVHDVDSSRFFFFDIKPETARYIHAKNPDVQLAPSVAHAYDIQRYNLAVGGTLISLSEAITLRELYSWVWLDEWDTLNVEGGKKLYTGDVFSELRKHNFKIGLVTPELHGTSPGLLGGEKHADATPERLWNRIREIVLLNPDAVCTDYPDRVRGLLS